METQIESFWILALASKCSTFSSQNTLLIIFLICVIWFSISLLYWAHPGGPAWGRYRCKNRAQKKTTSSNTPNAIIPGPRGFPVIGSFNLMANPAHRRLATEADRLGAKRLMAYSLGETRVIVTCNPDVAKEILNSSVFADRPVKESAYSLMFNRAIGFAPYGVYWRTLRRIAATHLFSPKQISASEGQRYGIASQMVSEISRRMSTGLRNDDGFCVVVRDVLKRASLHNMMGSVFGSEYELGSAFNAESDELGQLVDEGYELLGKLNWSDHLPWLGSLDLQRIRFRCSQLVPRVNRFVTRIIQEHRTKSLGTKTTHDFVDVLLSLHGPDKLSDHDMIAVLWEMIFRGTDTVAVLIEWILARMVLHPEVQSKVQDELDQVVGRSRPLTQSDIPSLVYLPAVVKEVLRLHPPGPLLSWARLATMDTVVDGFHVPAGTTAMVNMWAITRDPQVWSEPLEFDPERFATRREADVDFSVMGSDLRLAPFGSGRRTCPGKALGLTTVIFWVGALLHEFKWVGSGHDPVDLSEVLRLSCEMAKPLAVKVCPRRIA
ncbi:Cytochrome P450, E-class, group I [Trema orientale]|uniref:Cytochrome P450, E-class, group I n=1 Tax=Trema orientale TaxID=63057 RepID=A0A2P5F4T3_TREOI|nr:Cytochrome P450, E-class, group I [Trema orientale]